jgi:hypothetical protein
MAKKKAEPPVRIKRSELKNYSRSQQRYFLDLGYVEGETPPNETK